MTMVDAVLFDVNETLLELGPIRAAFVAVGLDPQRMDPWFRGVLLDGIAAAAAGTYAAFPDIARHRLGDELVAADLPVGDRAETVIEAFGSLAVHADVAPALERLQAAGMPAVALTNGTAGVVRAALQRAGLTHLVADCWDVGEVGRWKPSAAPYRWAGERLGLPPSRLALVAVHPWDIHGASAAGLRGIFVDRAKTHRYPPYLLAPAVTATDLDDAITQLL